jgi:hypothetical protein
LEKHRYVYTPGHPVFLADYIRPYIWLRPSELTLWHALGLGVVGQGSHKRSGGDELKKMFFQLYFLTSVRAIGLIDKQINSKVLSCFKRGTGNGKEDGEWGRGRGRERGTRLVFNCKIKGRAMLGT